MKYQITICVVALALPFAARSQMAVASSRDMGVVTPFDASCGQHGPASPILRHSADLALAATQIDELHAVNAQAARKNGPLISQLHTLGLDVDSAGGIAPPSIGSVREWEARRVAFAAARPLLAEIHKNVRWERANAFAVLTPEQRVRVRALLERDAGDVRLLAARAEAR